MTYEQYNTMNINDLEDFKCSQCKLELKDLQCTETSKITQQNWMIHLPQSPEPDTRYYLHLFFMGYSFYLLHCLLKMKIILEKKRCVQC